MPAGAVRDALEDFLSAGLCALLGSADAAAALFGAAPNTPNRGNDFSGFLGGDLCGRAPEEPSRSNLPPPAEFDEGFGWYVFASGNEFNSFTCQPGAAIPRRKVAKFSNSFQNVIPTTDKKRIEFPPCEYVFGKNLNLIRADGTIQEGSFDGPGGVNGRLGGFEIIRYTGEGYTPNVLPPPDGWDRVEGPVTVSPPGSTPFTIPIVAIYAPVTVALDGSIEIPITVDVGGIQINFTYDASRNEYRTGPTGDGRDYRPGDQPGDIVSDPLDPIPPPASDVPPPPGFDPDPDGDPSEEDVIIGCLVTVTQVQGGLTQVPQGNNPDLWLPDVGTIAFATRINGNTFAWSNPERVQGLRQYIECPWRSGAIAVEGTPRNGVAWTLTPAYSQKRSSRVGAGL